MENHVLNIINMRKIILLLIILINSLVVLSQKDTIKYVFTDNVEEAIFEQISEINKKIDTTCYQICLSLTHTADYDIFRLIVSYQKNNIANRSNRMAIIKDKYYPMIFDFDSFFVAANDSIASYGQRNDNVLRTYYCSIGSLIVFNWRADKIIEIKPYY